MVEFTRMTISERGDVEGAAGPGETWVLVFKLFRLMRTHFEGICAEFGLSPAQGQALIELDPARPQGMGLLAGRLGNDASNVTGIVDRLEARGLVERRVAENDRRVKTLVVTGEGEALRERFVARLKDAPSPVTALPEEDQHVLRSILRRVLD